MSCSSEHSVPRRANPKRVMSLHRLDNSSMAFSCSWIPKVSPAPFCNYKPSILQNIISKHVILSTHWDFNEMELLAKVSQVSPYTLIGFVGLCQALCCQQLLHQFLRKHQLLHQLSVNFVPGESGLALSPCDICLFVSSKQLFQQQQLVMVRHAMSWSVQNRHHHGSPRDGQVQAWVKSHASTYESSLISHSFLHLLQ